MAKNSSKKPSVKAVFDVSKPGKSTPTPTSRPVITGHGPMLKDPMVSDTSDEEKIEVKTTPKLASTGKSIKPITESEPEEKDSPKTADKPTEDKSVEEKPAEESSGGAEPALETEDEPETSAEDTPSETSTNEASAAVDAMASEADKKKQSKEEQEAAALQQKIDGLVEAGTYSLPIGQVTRRRNSRRAVIFVVVLLIAVLLGAYAAVDAGMLDAGIELPVEFINN